MIENTPLDTTTAAIFTAPGTAGDLNVQSAITTMIFCNNGSVNPADETENKAVVNVYLVKHGQTADPAVNAVIQNLTIPAGDTLFFDTERVVLSSGDAVWADATITNTSGTPKVIATVSVLPV
jgi:hypothetical protein